MSLFSWMRLDQLVHLGRIKRSEHVVCHDISNGREKHCMPALSYVKSDRPPDDYHYVSEYIQLEPIKSSYVLLSDMHCCTCLDDCGTQNCACALIESESAPYNRVYDAKRHLSCHYNIDAPEVIRECNIGCRCNAAQCQNMVIQGGCQARLALFRTKRRGWGVRTLEHLKRGTFIGVYSGELISADSSHGRADDTYLFNLTHTHIYSKPAPGADEQAAQDCDSELGEQMDMDTEPAPAAAAKPGEREDAAAEAAEHQQVQQQQQHDGEHRDADEADGFELMDKSEVCDVSYICSEATLDSGISDADLFKRRPSEAPEDQQDQPGEPARHPDQFVCDAKRYGNFTRFINHSCEPNVTGIRSFTKHQDPRFPYIAFFTNRDVKAHSELTLNYGDNYWMVKCQRDNVFCLCKRPRCRFSKKAFPRTLAQHNAKKQQQQSSQ